jgi:hypothetical protein
MARLVYARRNLCNIGSILGLIYFGLFYWVIAVKSTLSFFSSSRSIHLLGVLLLALVLRLILFVGYANVDPWDDTLYLRLAQQVREGTVDQSLRTAAEQLHDGPLPAASAFVVRRGTYVPIAFSQALFGTNERASALPSLAASLGTLLLVYLIGYRLAGAKVALMGSVLFAFIPLDLVYSTRILADVPHTFWITVSVAAVIEATRGSYTPRGRWILFMISGLCLAFAYATRSSGLFLGIPLVLAALAAARDRRQAFVGSLITWAVLTGVVFLDAYRYLQSMGSFGFPFRIEKAASLGMFTFNPEAVLYPLSGLAVHCSYEEGVPNHFFKLFLGTVDHYGGLKLFSAFAPLGVVALLFSLANRRLFFLVFWLLFVFVFYQYGFRGLQWDGEQGVLHYFLVAHRPRYLHLLLPALTLVLGDVIVEAHGRNRFAGILLVLLLLGPGTYRAHQNYVFYRGSLEDMRVASRFLLQQDPAPIYSDPWGVELLRFFSGGELTELRVPQRGVPLEPGSWAVLGGARGYDLASREVASSLPRSTATYHMAPNQAPQDWQRAFTRKGPRNPARRSDLVIYSIP